MVSDAEPEFVARDYTRASKVLIAISLRILNQEEHDEPDPGLRPSVN
jgi:hypothetical protein